MTKYWMKRVLIALFALSLIGGMAVAQAAKTSSKTTTAAASNADLLDINTATKENKTRFRGSERLTRRKSSTAGLMQRRPTWCGRK